MNTATPKYRTLIADDEQPARDRLKKLLAEHPDKIELIGEAKNGIECREMIDRLKPDLVFLDIQMPGLNGFEVLQQTSHSPVVIFCTAFDEFALKSLEDKLGDKFLRIHRSLLVNVSRIKEIDKHFSSRFVVKMEDIGQTKLITGRNYCEQVRKLMEI